MNFFEQHKQSYDYLDNMKNKFNEMMNSAAKIRLELGKYKYLFDKYLECILDNINITHASMAAEFGFDSCGKLRGLCCKALNNNNNILNTPAGRVVKEYIDSHPIKYIEDQTKVEMYMVYLHNIYLKYAIQDFINEETEKDNSPYDSAEAKTVYNKIVQIMGNEESLSQFNKLFTDYFFINKKINIFINGFLNNIVYALLFDDSETEQTVFQLIFDDIAEVVI